eukprot:2032382-Pleurochrysis_carterae.AAC.3
MDHIVALHVQRRPHHDHPREATSGYQRDWIQIEDVFTKISLTLLKKIKKDKTTVFRCMGEICVFNNKGVSSPSTSNEPSTFAPSMFCGKCVFSGFGEYRVTNEAL